MNSSPSCYIISLSSSFLVWNFKGNAMKRSSSVEDEGAPNRGERGEKTGTLFLVSTPIGNLKDITLRALEVLSRVDSVVAEDPEAARRLLSAYGISKPIISYHEQGERWQKKADKISRILLEGKSLALVSEAGTPGLSDPGYGLVRRCLELHIPLEVAPGPSVILSALVMSGIPANKFVFEGFLPRGRAQRRRTLEGLKKERRTMVFFESPRRLSSTLADMAEILGERRGAVVRELTKAFQEIKRGLLTELRSWAQQSEIKGEVTIVVEGTEECSSAELELRERVRFLMERCSLGPKETIRVIKEETGLPKKLIYEVILRQRSQGSTP
jgi:16S rRNA (cytidine1402-2'-O)-methyltransferase